MESVRKLSLAALGGMIGAGCIMEFGEIKGLEGKTIKSVQSFIEEGIPTLQIFFTDETSFSYRSRFDPTPRCLYFNTDGELAQEWETNARC